MLSIVLNHLRDEIHAIKTAPAAFIGTVLIATALIWAALAWRDSGIIENKNSRIQTLTDENSRLQVALDLKAATPSALLALSNKELKVKALNVVAKLRDIDATYQNGMKQISNRTDVDDKQKDGLSDALTTEMDQQFAKEVRSDTFNIDFELRRRLGPKAVAGIIGISPSVKARDGSRVDLLQLTSIMPAVELGSLTTLTNGIEQMAKLLPDNG